MLKLKLPKNRVEFLVQELEKRADLAVVERGWQYYHRGLVEDVQLVHGYILQADVRGKQTFRPSLDLEQFNRSECTCSHKNCCKHMAALIFYMYSAHSRPELLLMQLKQTIQSKKRALRQSALKTGFTERSLELLPEAKPGEWVRFFEQRFYGYSLSNQHSIEQFYSAVQESLGTKAAGWPERLQSLYSLHLSLYVLGKIDQFHQENQSSYLSFHIENSCKIVAGQCWDMMKETVGQIDPGLAADEYPHHWRETISIVGEGAVRHHSGPVRWLDVYRFLWRKLFDSPETREAEKKRLELLLKQNHAFPRVKDGLLLALAQFDRLAGEDSAAFERLQELHTKQMSDFYLVLDQLSEEQDWERLLTWLRWLLPVLAKTKQEDFNKGCAYWLEAMKHQPSDEEWIRVMLSLLPRSYYYYTDYLMQTKRYRHWVDLQLAAGVTPANLYTAELRTVEAHDPALLLPLFHQSVEKAVLEKNRDSYKLAIRLLKKLHGFYKQLNRLDRWNEYIQLLSAKYSRLRAFQEELSKGKWTS